MPYTSTPPGSPCGCVYPMQIELGLGVALYAFFPLVSELASQIAAGTFLKQSQVRIMGANAYSQDQEKTIVDIDLVPLGENFDNTTAFLIFDRFWQKKVLINETLFGDYWVIYINYPGLPQSPPSAYPNTNYNGVPNSDSDGSSKRDPLGVDVNKQSDKMGAGTIAVVALSSAIAMIICLGTVWIIMLKCRNQNRQTSAVVEPMHVPSSTKDQQRVVVPSYQEAWQAPHQCHLLQAWLPIQDLLKHSLQLSLKRPQIDSILKTFLEKEGLDVYIEDYWKMGQKWL